MDMQVLDDQSITYLQQLCTDTECSLEDLPEAMDNKEN